MQLEISARDIERILKPLAAFPNEAGKVLKRTLARSGQNMATNLSREIRKSSFLKAGDVRKALSRPLLSGDASGMQVEVTVGSRQLAMDHFRLVPARITARKGLASVNWPNAGYQIGPGEPVRFAETKNRGRAFVTRFAKAGRLLLLQRQGRKLLRVFGYSVQYFASFDAVKTHIESQSRDYFERRLAHEIDFALGKLK